MKIKIKQYKDEKTYKRIFDDNFTTISDLEKYQSIKDLLLYLSSISNISYDIILLDFKRFYMVLAEKNYNNLIEHYKKNYYLLRMLLKSIIFGFSGKKYNVDIVIDNFSEGVLKGIYSDNLIKELYKKYSCRTYDFSSTKYLKIIVFLKNLKSILKSFKLAKTVLNSCGFNLNLYINKYFSEYLSGISSGKAKVVITANDNGCPIIKAKAMGASVVAIQNGFRTYTTDASFKYVDHYITIGAEEVNKIRYNMGCRFGYVYPLGSIRLYNYLNKNSIVTKNEYDIVFIDWDNLEAHGKDYYRRESEIKVIKLLNAFADNSNYKITAHYRFKENLNYLKEHKLMSKNIDYFCKDDLSGYELIMKSELVLSSNSTLVLEAMGINKKGGFINLSGNKSLLAPFESINIELNKNNLNSLSLFVDRLLNQKLNLSRIIRQDNRYIDNALEIIKGILK